MDYLVHYGVLGMHWGVRRYQPYDVVPRGSGEGGKEIGEAAKKNKKIAKKNVKSAFKQTESDTSTNRWIDKKIHSNAKAINKRIAKRGDSPYDQKLVNLRRVDQSLKENKKATEQRLAQHKAEVAKAKEVVGSEYVNKLLKKHRNASIASSVVDPIITAGAAAVSSTIASQGSVTTLLFFNNRHSFGDIQKTYEDLSKTK